MFIKNPRRPLLRLAMIAGAIGLFLVGYYWGHWYKLRTAGPPNIKGVLVRPAQPLPAFELKDAMGRPFTEKDLPTHWTLLAFADLGQARGHLAIMRMIDTYNRLADQEDLHKQMLLVLAAKAQTPELAQDFSRLSPALRVLSGKAEEIEKLRAAVGDAPGPGDSPAQDEGAPIFLIDPKGRLFAVFTGEEQPAAIAKDLSALAERPDLLLSEQQR
jgi:cytochrome oxidase Cu insertion factor (SCO1/SenC/PrrC family)